MTLESILTSMGYRELTDDKWAKPVGYNLLTYEISKQLFTNWFKGKDDQLYVWSSTVLEFTELSDFLPALKAEESITRLDISTPSDFEFLTRKDSYLLSNF